MTVSIRVRKEPIDKIITPFHSFLKAESSGGIVLLLAAILALIWANSPWGHFYFELWETSLSFGLGQTTFSQSLHFWINDGLMAIFFFLVGLEIKRELIVGELSALGKASLPVFAALGGMIIPAAIYSAFNSGPTGVIDGFGVPMATDIAFAVGIVALLGDKVSTSAKVFLTALAIVDDIGAALIIALFYSGPLQWSYFFIALAFFGGMLIINRLGFRHIIVYSLFGLGVWLGFLASGIHPTLSGILAAFSIPVRTKINAKEFINHSQEALTSFKKHGQTGISIIATPSQQAALHTLEQACALAESPLQRLEHMIHPWVAFLIMPLFALANAGVQLKGFDSHMLLSPITLGVAAGLFFGKQLGIFLFTWLAVKLRLAFKSHEFSWQSVYGVGCLAGIGFTMSIFISGLAFTAAEHFEMAKIGIFVGSFASGALGWLILSRQSSRNN